MGSQVVVGLGGKGDNSINASLRIDNGAERTRQLERLPHPGPTGLRE